MKPATPEVLARDVRAVALEAVQRANGGHFDGPRLTWRAEYVAAVLDGLLLVLPPEQRDILRDAAGKLRESADYELEEAWPE